MAVVRYRLTFKLGPKTVARVESVKDVDRQLITLSDLERVFEVESFLERLTGYRVHIEQVAGATSEPSKPSSGGG